MLDSHLGRTTHGIANLSNGLPPMTIRELVVYDSEETCPYLPGRSARMPLRRPLESLQPAAFDARLAAGDRRTGAFLYNTHCENCTACEAIRVPVADFRMSRSQRRVWRKGQTHITTTTGPPLVTPDRVALFNRHRFERGLAKHERAIDSFSYEHFLVDSCCETRELRYFDDGRLVGIAICDIGHSATSAVYTFFDPEYREVSIGVYSVLKQLEVCREENKQWLYLGYYVAESPHMKYKANYLPHERRISGCWQRFEN